MGNYQKILADCIVERIGIEHLQTALLKDWVMQCTRTGSYFLFTSKLALITMSIIISFSFALDKYVYLSKVQVPHRVYNPRKLLDFGA